MAAKALKLRAEVKHSKGTMKSMFCKMHFDNLMEFDVDIAG